MKSYILKQIIKGTILFAVIMGLLFSLKYFSDRYTKLNSLNDSVRIVTEDKKQDDNKIKDSIEVEYPSKIETASATVVDVEENVVADAEAIEESTVHADQEENDESNEAGGLNEDGSYMDPYVSLTNDEIYEFAILVYLEAGGESYECQKAVASVVLNRMVISCLSFHDVIYSPGQFEPADQIPYTDPSESCLAAVQEVVWFGPTLPIYVTYFRSAYYFDWVEPYTCIDNTYFSYSEDIRMLVEGC